MRTRDPSPSADVTADAAAGIPAAPGPNARVAPARARPDCTAARRPGRPRSEQAEQAILDATLEAVGDRGIDGVSCEDVAARAGVGKATLYRRWPGKEDLLIAAFAALKRPLPEPRGESVRDDLIAMLEVMAEDADDPRFAQQYALLHAEGRALPPAGGAVQGARGRAPPRADAVGPPPRHRRRRDPRRRRRGDRDARAHRRGHGQGQARPRPGPQPRFATRVVDELRSSDLAPPLTRGPRGGLGARRGCGAEAGGYARLALENIGREFPSLRVRADDRPGASSPPAQGPDTGVLRQLRLAFLRGNALGPGPAPQGGPATRYPPTAIRTTLDSQFTAEGLCSRGRIHAGARRELASGPTAGAGRSNPGLTSSRPLVR